MQKLKWVKLKDPVLIVVFIENKNLMVENNRSYYIPYLSKTTEVTIFPQKEGHAVMQYMCDTAPGQSGGPVCTDGAIVGIHSAHGAKGGNAGLLITTSIHLWINDVCSEA